MWMLAYKFSGKIIRFYVVCIGWFFMIADICANLNFRCDVIYEYRHMFLTGAVATVVITVFMRAFAWLCRTISWLYITFFRGTPMYVQIFIWYFVWFVALVHPQHGLIVSGSEAVALRREYGAWIAGCLALTANTGAYITEIFRAGIQSIDKGQMEAARSLGLTYPQAMRFIILPQALRRMLPPLANEFITLLKDSSLLAMIAVPELAYVQKTISGRYSIYEEPLYTVALVYLAMTICLSAFFSWLEKRFSTGHRK